MTNNIGKLGGPPGQFEINNKIELRICIVSLNFI